MNEWLKKVNLQPGIEYITVGERLYGRLTEKLNENWGDVFYAIYLNLDFGKYI